MIFNHSFSTQNSLQYYDDHIAVRRLPIPSTTKRTSILDDNLKSQRCLLEELILNINNQKDGFIDTSAFQLYQEITAYRWDIRNYPQCRNKVLAQNVLLATKLAEMRQKSKTSL